MSVGKITCCGLVEGEAHDGIAFVTLSLEVIARNSPPHPRGTTTTTAVNGCGNCDANDDDHSGQRRRRRQWPATATVATDGHDDCDASLVAHLFVCAGAPLRLPLTDQVCVSREPWSE